MGDKRVIVATPHDRYQPIVDVLGAAGHEVHRLRTPQELTVGRLEEIAPDWVLFPHWSYYIPSAIHERFRCVIFHMTDVPYGRGGSPLQNLIVRGHQTTMMSALVCAAEMDAGDVYLKRPLRLEGDAEQIYRRAASLIASMAVELVRDDPVPVAQTGQPVEFRRRTPDQSRLPTRADLSAVYDHIRMLDADGYPRAFAHLGELRLEFRAARLEGDQLSAEVSITVAEEAEL